MNDFGAGNIDAALVAQTVGDGGWDTIALHNGCVCCAIGDDLSAALGRVLDAPIPFDAIVIEAIVIEASAVSDPWRMAQLVLVAAPAMGAILSARLLPPSGGDTLWASGAAAWDALCTPWQRLLAGLNTEHDFLKSFPAHRFTRSPAERQAWDKARTDHPPRLHPVVRAHPVTGRQGLFVNEGFTTRIVELSATESHAVLRQLFAHLCKPEFTVRWRWKVGDLAFWDNRLTQHDATADYLPNRRVMHRATILGDVPFYRAPG